ncbi:17621_t:CDS:2, partial [Funneliformis geosporum]
LTKEQVEVHIPIQPTGKREEEEYLNWLTDDIGELFDMRHCNCNKKTINSSSETSSSKTDSSEESDTDYASYKASIGPKKKDEDIV